MILVAVPDESICIFDRCAGDENSVTCVVASELEGCFEGNQDTVVDIAVNEVLHNRLLHSEHIFRIVI